ncbi:transmembrane and TPR repeat-containing protein 4-like [Lingula anatina]|uniref:dolichyl-phosphate-mannose--protein mannosyltransferase n=1 Tax=Lingula anatina TaxID=7574 RepID=A0A1S3H2T3_LINAN|nr:transmembrane and TPR repeat-containing protein 4-like [Lingula anatina]XP_013379792.1 transmembrane and TPR repeat-containing protein 4-like [Lingula anatina]|eukprot:XP_013379791.1 transmembrane and TPR repeat-containing protein 4-like [Lingula anatina]
MRKRDASSKTTIKTERTQKQISGSQKRSWDDSLPLPKLNFSVTAAAVFLLAVLCYANSYDGDFVFDDSEAIINNEDLMSSVPLTDLFYHDFWGSKLAGNTSHKSYRPLTVLTFRWNAYLAGGLYPKGFHVTNILLHGVVSLFILHTIVILFGGVRLDERGRIMFTAPKASFLCAMLFATHPIHTENVAGVVGRADLLCAFCFLLSFLCYVRACHSDPLHFGHKPEIISVSHLLSSLVLCGLSVLFKEQGITVIGVCSAYDILVICRADPKETIMSVVQNFTQSNCAASSKNQQKSNQWIKSLVYRHLSLLAAGVTILAARWQIMGSAPPKFQEVDNPHSFVNETMLRVLNYSYLYSINVWLLLCPWWLCFDWSMGCVPVISVYTDLRLLPTLAFLSGMALLFYYCIFGNPSRIKRLYALSLAILIIPFLPASNLFFRVGFVVAERVLYLPSLGFCMLVTLGLVHISRIQALRKIAKIFVPVILIIFIIKSMQRSLEWRSEKELFFSGAKVCPGNAKVHYNIAKVSADGGDTSGALESYRLAIRLNPMYEQAMNNLANILKDRGESEAAETLLLKAVEIRPEFAAAWMNLGIVQSDLKKEKLAEQSYFNALTHRRKYPDCYYNLGNLYLETKKHDEALAAWKNATLLRPTHLNSWNNMILLLDNLGRIDEAERVTKIATKYLPSEPQLYYNLANAQGNAGRHEDSERNFLKAIQLDGKKAVYYANLGVLYHRWNKYEQAGAAYRKALKLDPNSPLVKENLEKLLRKMEKEQQEHKSART